jgi:hypothetical protein
VQGSTTLRAVCFYLFVAGLLSINVSCQKTHSETDEAAQDKQAAQSLVPQADKLYAQRDDLMKVRQGIILLRQARTADANNYDAAWRLAEFNYFLGTHTKEGAEREKALADGVEAGKAAVKLQPNRPEGHFWLGAGYGGRAQSSSLTGLTSQK